MKNQACQGIYLLTQRLASRGCREHQASVRGMLTQLVKLGADHIGVDAPLEDSNELGTFPGSVDWFARESTYS